MPAYPELGPRPRLGYTQSLIDRAAEAAYRHGLARPPEGSRTLTYVIGGEMIVLKKRGNDLDPAFAPDEARALAAATETVFLGLIDGAARFGIGIAQRTPKR